MFLKQKLARNLFPSVIQEHDEKVYFLNLALHDKNRPEKRKMRFSLVAFGNVPFKYEVNISTSLATSGSAVLCACKKRGSKNYNN